MPRKIFLIWMKPTCQIGLSTMAQLSFVVTQITQKKMKLELHTNNHRCLQNLNKLQLWPQRKTFDRYMFIRRIIFKVSKMSSQRKTISSVIIGQLRSAPNIEIIFFPPKVRATIPLLDQDIIYYYNIGNVFSMHLFVNSETNQPTIKWNVWDTISEKTKKNFFKIIWTIFEQFVEFLEGPGD